MKKLFWSRIDNKKEPFLINSDEISHTDQNRYEKPIKNNLKVWNLMKKLIWSRIGLKRAIPYWSEILRNYAKSIEKGLKA